MRTSKLFMVAAAVALLIGVAPIMAQDQAAPAPSTIQGQLVRVDATAKTFSVRTESGLQIMFSYDDQTKVTGSDDDVAGLATISGTDVKVDYVKKGQENVATQIEVMKKPAA